jgi:hypothetical protein
MKPNTKPQSKTKPKNQPAPLQQPTFPRQTQPVQQTLPQQLPPLQTPVQNPSQPTFPRQTQPVQQTLPQQLPPLQTPVQIRVKPEVVYDSDETEVEEMDDVYEPQTLPVMTTTELQPLQNLKSEETPTIIPAEITLEAYLKLFEQKIKLENELIQMKNKLFEAQFKLQNKVNNNPNATELKDKLIELLLESPLNIESIPDDVERQIYRFILEQLDTGVQVATKCCVIM